MTYVFRSFADVFAHMKICAYPFANPFARLNFLLGHSAHHSHAYVWNIQNRSTGEF